MNKKIIAILLIVIVLGAIAVSIFIFNSKNRFDEYKDGLDNQVEGGLELGEATSSKIFINNDEALSSIPSEQLTIFYDTLEDHLINWSTCSFVKYDYNTKNIYILDDNVERVVEYDEYEKIYYIIFNY